MTTKANRPDVFWWRDINVGLVTPFDYPPARVAAARRHVTREGARLPRIIRAILDESRSPEDAVRRIVCFVQSALVHPPLLQPAETTLGYWWWRGFAPRGWDRWPRFAQLLGHRLVMDPEVLLALGEGRCGQCVALLCEALRIAGFKARPWQLPRHIVAEVELAGEWRVVDADAFKNGILLEGERGLATRRMIEDNPYLVDGFKPTGWPFRRDSAYARRASTSEAFRGYIDFYSPEEDAQISARYDAPMPLLPPGVPRWITGGVPERPLQLALGKAHDLAFGVCHAERARGYRVRCGRRSRGYRYDALVLDRLGGETSGEVFEHERREPDITVRLDKPGRYYLTAASLPAYLDEIPSYVWWSDELIVDVV